MPGSTEYIHVTAKLMHIRGQIQTNASRQAPEARAGRDAGLGRQPLKTGPAEEVGLALGVEVGLLVGLELGVLVGVLDAVSVRVGDAVGVAEGLAVDDRRLISRHVPPPLASFFLPASADGIRRGDHGHRVNSLPQVVRPPPVYSLGARRTPGRGCLMHWGAWFLHDHSWTGWSPSRPFDTVAIKNIYIYIYPHIHMKHSMMSLGICYEPMPPPKLFCEL